MPGTETHACNSGTWQAEKRINMSPKASLGYIASTMMRKLESQMRLQREEELSTSEKGLRNKPAWEGAGEMASR